MSTSYLEREGGTREMGGEWSRRGEESEERGDEDREGKRERAHL